MSQNCISRARVEFILEEVTEIRLLLENRRTYDGFLMALAALAVVLLLALVWFQVKQARNSKREAAQRLQEEQRRAELELEEQHRQRKAKADKEKADDEEVEAAKTPKKKKLLTRNTHSHPCRPSLTRGQ